MFGFGFLISTTASEFTHEDIALALAYADLPVFVDREGVFSGKFIYAYSHTQKGIDGVPGRSVYRPSRGVEHLIM